MPTRYDLVVIGSGPAGEKAAAQAAYFGKRVALVERSAEPGGACVHTGTLPSKTLRETALYLSGFHARELYSLSMSFDPLAEVQAMMHRKAAIAGSASRQVRANLERHRVDYLCGAARFVETHALELTAPDGALSRIEGERFLIATGSSPVRPAELDMADPDIYDSDEILELDRLPATLVILGGGVIGCEYACIFAALGVKVTLVDAHPAILTFLDGEVVGALRVAMEKLGVRFALGAKWGRVAREGERSIAAELASGVTLHAEKLLYAAGRTGNSAGLGLEVLGLEPDARGNLAVNAHFQTAVPHVYAAGDVIGFPALASVSMDQGRVAACHACSVGHKSQVDPLLPYGIYTLPEVSAVGETEETCRKKNLAYVTGRALHKDNARGQITGDLDGLTKLIVEASTRKVIGVHVVGERASELVHIGQAVMHLGGTVDAFVEMVFNYPTLSESYKYAAYAAMGELDALAEPRSA